MKKILSFIMCAAMLSGSLLCVHADDALSDITEDDKYIITSDAVTSTGDEDASVKPVTDVAIPVHEIMPSTKVLIIGDSNACGYGLTTGTVESGLTIGSFADVFASEILKENQTAEMFAAPGATLQSLVNIIEDPEQSVVLANALNQVDIVDINLGGNDLLKVLYMLKSAQPSAAADEASTASDGKISVSPIDAAGLAGVIADSFGASIKQFGLNFSKIMEFINSLENVPYVAVNAVPTPDTAKITQFLSDDMKLLFKSVFTDEYIAAIVESANNILRTADVKYHSTFVDASALTLTTQDDGIHFDLDGHSALGKQVFKNVAKVIKEARTKNLLLFNSIPRIIVTAY